MKFLICIFALGFSLNTFAGGASGPGPSAVQDFEVEKYLGTWYEIGSIPQKFQKGCECTRATYAVRADSTLDVLNECRKEGVNGPVTEARGKAKFKGASDVGDLEVSFFLWFYGSYRIIALDQNYQWSVVSNDKAKTLWILSRSPVMAQGQVADLLEIAKNQGVDTSTFTLQQQDGCWK